MKKNRKILLLLKPPPPYGGGELRARALKEFVEKDKEFHVLDFSSKRDNKATQGVIKAWKVKEFILQFLKYLRVIIRSRPSLVFIHSPKSFIPFFRNSVFFWGAYFFRIPCVSELAGMTFNFLHEGRIKRWYGSLVLRRMKCLRVLGKSIANDLNELGIKNTYISDNGVALKKGIKYCPYREDGLIQILFVGAHSPQKGFDILIEAIKSLVEREHQVVLHTIGEWISQDFTLKIIQYINSYKLTERIVLHGLKFKNEKWDIFSQSQILALPSLNEGQPLVILEGLGCGIPIVASRVGAIPDTIENGKNGYLIDPGSKEQLVEYLEKLIVDQKLRVKISRENIKLFHKRFALEKYLSEKVKWLKYCSY